jgi:hypothetical protein
MGKGGSPVAMRLRNSRCGNSGSWRPLEAPHPLSASWLLLKRSVAGVYVASEMVFASRRSTDGRLGDDLRSTPLCLVKTPTTKKKLQLYYHRPGVASCRSTAADAGPGRTPIRKLRRAIAKREKVIEHGVGAGSISIGRRICRTR